MFLLLALSINFVDSMLTRSADESERRLILAIASTFDLVIVVTALYYWLLVRPGIRAQTSLIVVALLGVVRATYLYPNARALKIVVVGLCEAALIGFAVIQVRRQNLRSLERNLDPVEALRTALQSLLPVPAVVSALAAELGIWYYAVFSWRSKPHAPAGTQPFTIYRRVGQAELLGVLPLACALEVVPVHLLLKNWSSMLAWIATGLSLYSLIWVVGIARAFWLRPTLAAREYIHLRYGLFFQLRVPREMILSVRGARADDSGFAVPRRSQPSVCIEFARPMNAEGLFGIRRPVSRAALTPDDQQGFENALAQFIAND